MKFIMKKVCLIILLILIILIITIVLIHRNNDNEIDLKSTQSSTDFQSIDNIFISVEDNSISPIGLTVIVDDKNEVKSNKLISMRYFIDKKIENGWEEIYYYLSPIEISVSHIEYPHKSKLNWANELGELKQGTYRIRYYPILNKSKEIEFNIN